MADPAINEDNTFPPGWADDLPADQIRRRIIAGWAPIERQTMIDRILALIIHEGAVTTDVFLQPLGHVHYRNDEQRRLTIARVMAVLHEVLQALAHPGGRMMINLRGLIYRLRHMMCTLENGDDIRLFRDNELYNTIIDCCQLCRCNRQSLAIWAGDDGFITGAASMRLTPGGQLIELNDLKMSINGDVAEKANLHIEGDFSEHPDGIILVVESEEVFDTLRLGGLRDNRHILMITGRGKPSYTTRATLFKIHDLYPNRPILALTDYNLSGYQIYNTFRGRSVTDSGPGIGRIGFCAMYEPPMPIPIIWLGMNLADTEHVDLIKREALTDQEIRLIKGAITREGQHEDTPDDALGISEDCLELIRMRDAGFKAQISDMHRLGGPTLTDIVGRKIDEFLRQDDAGN